MFLKWLFAQRLRHRRNIFAHRAARHRVTADPVAVAIALHRHNSYLPRHLDEAIAGDQSAVQETVQAARDVFRVRLWKDEPRSGLTVMELLSLMVAFEGYCEALRDRYESLADATALYGGDVPSLWKADYEAFAGLWLNRHRELVRVAEATRLGISGAIGERRLGWFIATAESHEDAIAQFDMHRAEVAQSHAE